MMYVNDIDGLTRAVARERDVEARFLLMSAQATALSRSWLRAALTRSSEVVQELHGLCRHLRLTHSAHD